MEGAGIQVDCSAGEMSGVQIAKSKACGQKGGLWRHGLNDHKGCGERGALATDALPSPETARERKTQPRKRGWRWTAQSWKL